MKPKWTVNGVKGKYPLEAVNIPWKAFGGAFPGKMPYKEAVKGAVKTPQSLSKGSFPVILLSVNDVKVCRSWNKHLEPQILPKTIKPICFFYSDYCSG